MTDCKYTQDGLPVVSKETARLTGELMKRTWDLQNRFDHFMLEFYDRIEKENPDLACALRAALTNPLYSTAEKRAFSMGAYLMYEPLRQQMSANNLEKKLT